DEPRSIALPVRTQLLRPLLDLRFLRVVEDVVWRDVRVLAVMVINVLVVAEVREPDRTDLPVDAQGALRDFRTVEAAEIPGSGPRIIVVVAIAKEIGGRRRRKLAVERDEVRVVAAVRIVLRVLALDEDVQVLVRLEQQLATRAP